MDKELGSSRFHSGTRRYDNGGGYRGGYNRRGGGGGYHHRSRQGGGGGGGYYNNRYRNNRHSGGGGGGRGRGGGRSVNPHARSNRVSASSTKVDPTKAMLTQLTGMVAKIGDLSNAAEEIVNVKENAQNLAMVLCGDNAELFLKYESSQPVEGSIKENDNVVNTGASDGPGDTAMKDDEVEGDSFMEKIVSANTSDTKSISPENAAGPTAALIVHCAASLPLQTSAYVILTQEIESNAPASHANFASRCVTYALFLFEAGLKQLINGSSEEVDTNAFTLRLKLILRYLCMLEHTGLLGGLGNGVDESASVTSFILTTFLNIVKSQNTRMIIKSCICYIMLSNLPFYCKLDESRHSLSQEILSTVKTEVLDKEIGIPRLFIPGKGMNAVYLKEEQMDDDEVDDDEESDEGDEDENMEDGPDAPVYDSISELFNAVMILSENQWNGSEVSESILRTSNLTKFEGNAVSGVTFDEKVVEPEEIQNTGLNPLLTSAPPFVYARMPLFDGDTNDATGKFFEQTSKVDRALISHNLLDILYAFKPQVSLSGVQLGGVKLAAEQIASITKLFPSLEGAEYFMVDFLLSLITQQKDEAYLSRVLLELCKLLPEKIPQALAIGVGTAVTELPTFTPRVRYTLAEWFALHLTNTDYQWPYWHHWEEAGTEIDYQKSDRTRHIFLRQIISEMISLSTRDAIEGHIGKNLSGFIPTLKFESDIIAESNASPLACLARELLERINTRQPVDALSKWLTSSSEHTDIIPSDLDIPNWRSTSALNAILASTRQDPIEVQICFERYHILMKNAIEEDLKECNSTVIEVETGLLRHLGAICQNRNLVELIVEEMVRNGVLCQLSVFTWLLGKDEESLGKESQLNWDNCHVVRIMTKCLSLAFDILQNDSIAPINEESSNQYKKSLERILDLLDFSFRRAAAIITDASSNVVYKGKIPGLIVSLSSILIELCILTFTTLEKHEKKIAGLSADVEINGSRFSNILRQSKGVSFNQYSDESLERLADCIEKCL